MCVCDFPSCDSSQIAVQDLYFGSWTRRVLLFYYHFEIIPSSITRVSAWMARRVGTGRPTSAVRRHLDRSGSNVVAPRPAAVWRAGKSCRPLLCLLCGKLETLLDFGFDFSIALVAISYRLPSRSQDGKETWIFLISLWLGEIHSSFGK
jgi:hypothetical protein